MDLNLLAQTIWTQVVTVWNAPVPFILTAILMYFVMRAFIGGQYATRLANAESTEKLLERQLQEYKDKTGSETPDEVRARIDALEARIADMMQGISALGPRKLSAEQRNTMLPILDPFRGTAVSIASDAASADASTFSKGLLAAFNAAGWLTETPMVLGLGNPPPSGIGLRIPDPSAPTPPQQAIIQALKAGGLAFDVQAEPEKIHNDPGGRPRPAAQLVLTTRADD